MPAYRIQPKLSFLLIHSANPQSWPGFAHVVRPSVPTFQNLVKQNKAKTMVATGETVGLAEWFIDDTCPVFLYFVGNKEKRHLTKITNKQK